MAYRKLIVEGKEVRYTTGREFTKIRLEDQTYLIRNSILGQPYRRQFVVRPGNVARLIKGENPVETFHCEKHNYTTTELACDPFLVEIYDKVKLVPKCPECQHDRAMDI